MFDFRTLDVLDIPIVPVEINVTGCFNHLTFARYESFEAILEAALEITCSKHTREMEIRDTHVSWVAGNVNNLQRKQEQSIHWCNI